MMGIRLRDDDRVASMEVVQPGACLLVVTEKGYGKRTLLEEYPVKGRATGGVKTIDQRMIDEIIGRVAAARVVEDEDEVTLISSSGIIIRMKVRQISQLSRATRGVRVMDLGAGDSVASVAVISACNINNDGNGADPGSDNGRVEAQA
ncbi:MAG: DNA gyrase subunit A, partial [Phycisphaerales bacterium]|nr:DNA gyrase subunit A [Phycisphaerales bacterium]